MIIFELTIVSKVSPDLDTTKFKQFLFFLFSVVKSKSFIKEKFFFIFFLKKL